MPKDRNPNIAKFKKLTQTYLLKVEINLRKNYSNVKKATMLIFLLSFLAMAFSSTCKASSPAVSTVYIDSPTINGTADQQYNVTIYAKNFADLFTYGLGLSWDPNKVNCTTFYFGPTLPDDVFDVLAPTTMTLPMSGAIDNTKGTISLSAVTLVGATGVTGDTGVGYKLMKATFKFKVTGFCDIHLTDVNLLDSDSKQTRVNIIDYFTAWEGNYPVEILTNSTGIEDTRIFGHFFNTANQKLGFNLTSINSRSYASITDGFCNVTIPNDLMWVDASTDWVVTVNGASPLSLNINENATHYFLYFTYHHTGTVAKPEALKIEIGSKYVIPEFPTATILLLFLAFASMTVLVGKLLRSTRYRSKVIAN